MENEIKELTEAQKTMLSRRLDAIRADFGVVALHLLCADGSEWKVGEFPTVERNNKRSKADLWKEMNYKFGTLQKVVAPWCDLAISAPNEPIKLRPSDFPPDLALNRIIGSISARMAHTVGAGKYRVYRQHDTVEHIAITLIYLPQGVGDEDAPPRFNSHAINGSGGAK